MLYLPLITEYTPNNLLETENTTKLSEHHKPSQYDVH